jgi:hypothetical protein
MTMFFECIILWTFLYSLQDECYYVEEYSDKNTEVYVDSEIDLVFRLCVKM